MSLAHDALSRFDRSRAKLRATEFDLRLGEKIKSARLGAAMTQGALGTAIGVTFQQIHKYEYGEDRVSAAALQRIADALGVHPGTFFEGAWLHDRTGREPQRFT